MVGDRPLDVMALASPHTFEAVPALVWGFYGEMLKTYRHTQPHAGFEILQRWSHGKKFGAWVFTSNIDGQFQKAGFDPAYLEECHGSIHHLQCVRQCTDAICPADAIEPVVDASSLEMTSPLPRCPHCGGPARPNVLLFDDPYFLYDRTTEQLNPRMEYLSKIAVNGARIATIELGAGSY